jgi:hypothetical protein
MQERMVQMADEESELLKKAEAAIAKVLTSRQKQNFNKMLGADFDLNKLVENQGRNRGRGGEGRQGRGGQEGDEDGEDPAPATRPGAAPPAAAEPADPGDDEPAAAPTPPPRGGSRTRIPPRVRGYSGDAQAKDGR